MYITTDRYVLYVLVHTLTFIVKVHNYAYRRCFLHILEKFHTVSQGSLPQQGGHGGVDFLYN